MVLSRLTEPSVVMYISPSLLNLFVFYAVRLECRVKVAAGSHSPLLLEYGCVK